MSEVERSEIGYVAELAGNIRRNISKVIIGKDETIEFVLAALFASGHVLLDDVPGVGKTLLARCLARSVNCNFKRIQFTPDLLPSDLSGLYYFNQKTSEFVFRAGPLFTNILLADEINRATPRTQSSLLECMEEGQISIDGETMKLKKPFFVIATQNPVESRGTFPLPEAELDRFFVKLSVGYPSTEEGRTLMRRFEGESPFETLEAVTEGKELETAGKIIENVLISDELIEYMMKIVEETRQHEKVLLGVSPRGALSLMRASRGLAAFRRRAFVTPDDVKRAAVPVLAHRLVTRGRIATENTASGGFKSRTTMAEAIIHGILDKVPVPLEHKES